MGKSKVTPQQALEQAIEAAGGPTALGRHFGISGEAVIAWRANGVPADRVLRIEAITSIPGRLLRPDIYP